ncbi:MAG: amidotransferase [Gammaproteobacteria bacterium]|nr:amidotransferase [Gammaproteobacteria bacterium]
MRVHYLQHVPYEGIGAIRAGFHERAHVLSCTSFFDGGELPAPAQLDWLIVMGGPMSVHDDDRYPWLVAEKRFIEAVIDSGKTVLGVCLGAQLIAHVLGAEVRRMPQPEIGWHRIRVFPSEQAVSAALSDGMEAFHWHGEAFEIPAGAERLAASEACPNQAFVYGDRVIALQFHLESTPELVRGLVQNCGGELDASRRVQTPEQMLSSIARFDAANAAMRGLLHALEQLTGPEGGMGAGDSHGNES